jgi:hypothetical protein
MANRRRAGLDELPLGWVTLTGSLPLATLREGLVHRISGEVAFARARASRARSPAGPHSAEAVIVDKMELEILLVLKPDFAQGMWTRHRETTTFELLIHVLPEVEVPRP